MMSSSWPPVIPRGIGVSGVRVIGERECVSVLVCHLRGLVHHRIRDNHFQLCEIATGLRV